MIRRTKVICTIGPATSSEKVLTTLISTGMDCARINFSFGTFAQYRKLIKSIRKISHEFDKEVSILADLTGPKIRIGELTQTISLKNGNIIGLISSNKSSSNLIPINLPSIEKILKPGEKILMVDGKVKLRVKAINGKVVKAKVEQAGEISSYQGVNLPDTDLPLPALTDTDKKALEFALSQDIDWIALSFVRFPKDTYILKDIIATRGEDIGIIAKIERKEAIENLKKIIEISDGIMVARGDLGVEAGLEKVPILQKRIIQWTNEQGKPVITATQMLETMIYNPQPTRAEVSDIANAIFDGSDTLMLSGETATGKYPLQSLKTMIKIINYIEKSSDYKKFLLKQRFPTTSQPHDAIGHAAFQIACDLKAKAIFAATISGFTAQMIAKHRPPAPIYALTTNQLISRKLNIIWGIRSFKIKMMSNTDYIFEQAMIIAKNKLKLKRGDIIIIAAGVPPRKPGIANLLKIGIIE